MSATTFDIHEAETQLGQLLSMALKGSDIVITKDNIPLVRLVPVEAQKKRRIANLHKGEMKMSQDFNEPLSDDFWLGAK